jgi:tRNA (cytidine/uridine-2'-O-)-methyltransferase
MRTPPIGDAHFAGGKLQSSPVFSWSSFKTMFSVALYEPEIPPNTGNIIRLCANAGAALHLIEPLGFAFADKDVKRAGLDYHDLASVQIHPNWAAFAQATANARLFAFTTKASRCYADVAFAPGDVFLFGPESRGLPDALLAALPEERRLALPMRPGNRSLNLSNAVAIALYEAWRQAGFQ